jgi:hypothetical protein
VLPLLIFLLIWVIGGWGKRWPLLASFVVGMACLVGGGEWVLHGWILKFVAALADYRRYTGGVSILETLLTPLPGLMVTAILLLLVAFLAWRWRREPAGSAAFSLTLASVLAVTIVVIPTFAPYNQVLLLPGLMLLIRDWRSVTRLGKLTRLLYLLAALLVVWPWLASLYLTATSFWQAPAVVQRGWTLPLYTSLMIPFAIMALLGVYAAKRQAGRRLA